MVKLNCDIGEGYKNESEILPYISQANIACGGHAGNEQSMAHMVQLCNQFSVEIGAHPSYPDRINFGRKNMTISSENLKNSIHQQIENLEKIVAKNNSKIKHIKAHGALYNEIAFNPDLAKIYLSIVEKWKTKYSLFVPCGSIIEKTALKQGFAIQREAFVDRNYTHDLKLVSRTIDNALITDKKEVLTHIKNMYYNQYVITTSKEKIHLQADTFCIHSDTQNAVEIIRYIYQNILSI